MSINYPPSLISTFDDVVTNVKAAILADLQEYDTTIQNINFIAGNIEEIAKRLTENTANATERPKQYPVFLLMLDFTVQRGNAGLLYGKATDLNIIIANHTKESYTAQQRDEKNFTNILRPLYYEFLRQMAKHPAFSITSERAIPHNMTERYFWGVDAHTKNALGKYIDAIDITNLSVSINWNYCLVPITNNL
jgi:hypothetical protein